jgi:hypothetical protein
MTACHCQWRFRNASSALRHWQWRFGNAPLTVASFYFIIFQMFFAKKEK